MRTFVFFVLGLLPLVGCHHRVPVESAAVTETSPASDETLSLDPWLGLAMIDLAGDTTPHVALLMTQGVITSEVLENAVVLTGVPAPNSSWVFEIPARHNLLFERVEIEPTGLLVVSADSPIERVTTSWLLVPLVSQSGFVVNYDGLSGGRLTGDLYQVDLERARCRGDGCDEPD